MTAIEVPALGAPRGPYSHARRVGDLVFVAGVLGMDPDEAGGGSIEAQARRCFAQIRTILQAAGLDLGDLVKLTAFLTLPEEYAGYNAVRRELLDQPFPASTSVFVSGFVDPLARIEIEAVAAARRA